MILSKTYPWHFWEKDEVLFDPESGASFRIDTLGDGQWGTSSVWLKRNMLVIRPITPPPANVRFEPRRRFCAKDLDIHNLVDASSNPAKKINGRGIATTFNSPAYDGLNRIQQTTYSGLLISAPRVRLTLVVGWEILAANLAVKTGGQEIHRYSAGGMTVTTTLVHNYPETTPPTLKQIENRLRQVLALLLSKPLTNRGAFSYFKWRGSERVLRNSTSS